MTTAVMIISPHAHSGKSIRVGVLAVSKRGEGGASSTVEVAHHIVQGHGVSECLYIHSGQSLLIEECDTPVSA